LIFATQPDLWHTLNGQVQRAAKSVSRMGRNISGQKIGVGEGEKVSRHLDLVAALKV